MKHGRLQNLFSRSMTHRKVHFTSCDPVKHTIRRVREVVEAALDAGTDGFLLGGSTGVDREMVERYGRTIRECLDERFPGDPARPPLLLFPSSAATGLADAADGILFLSLLNSNDVRYLIREQSGAAPYLPAIGLVPIGCGMIMFEPGGTAGRIGHADLLRPDDWPTALGYAAAAAAFGFDTVYLNAGSGSPQPIPAATIRPIAEIIRKPLLVGGGLKDADQVREAVAAGADVIVTGTVVENNPRVGESLAAIVRIVHEQPPRYPAGLPDV